MKVQGRLFSLDSPFRIRSVSTTELRSTSPIRLTEWTSCGGCAAKWGASLITDLLSGIPNVIDPALLVGLAPFDDAAVYQLSPEVALVSTTDFFPPLVDDPSDFGAIAAANACSDVYAMGGRVVMAVNVAAFPEHFPHAAIAEIFAAAAAVVAEAGGSIAGGHTIRNPEPIFGLAVQGVVHPLHIFRKGGALAGDIALLSKPLGTGLALAGGSAADISVSIAGMRTLNRVASEQLQTLGSAVHGVTDVTGYGLAGHGWEMAERSGVQLVIDADALPAYPGAREAAQRGVRTGGDPRNRTYVDRHFVDSRPEHHRDDVATAMCMDPQTSGGLLAAVSPDKVAELLASTKVKWTRIGEFRAGAPCVVLR